MKSLMLGWALLAGSAAVAQTYEVPPDVAPADVLPPTLAAGSEFHVNDPIPCDGLMRQFTIESRFGTFAAYGRPALELRVHEIGALAELARTSKVAVVAGSVGRGVESQVETATAVIAHPIRTITGIPKGIAHLFSGYVDEGSEVATDVGGKAGPGTTGQGTAAAAGAHGEAAARSYARRYLGLTGAERHWYQKLGVDPYTDNEVLRHAIQRTAKLDAAAGFGMRFAGIPSIPGIGDIHEVMDAVYNEDPATIRAHTRKALEGYGLTRADIERFQNVIVMSPTRQLLLEKLAATLDGVGGRGELFRHATGLTSDAEARVYLRSVALLVEAHRQRTVTAILPGLRLPAASRADGSVIVCGAFDAIYWTEDVASGEAQIRAQLPADAARELWYLGGASDRARAELAARGWQLHESAQSPVAGGAPGH